MENLLRRTMRELRLELAGYGFRLKFRRRYFRRSRVYGYFDIVNKLVVCHASEKIGVNWILFNLFHEREHFRQYITGKYADYYKYDGDPEEVAREIIKSGIKNFPNLLTALRSELDCDKRAEECLRELKLKVPLHRRYRLIDTYTFAIHHYLHQLDRKYYLDHVGYQYYSIPKLVRIQMCCREIFTLQ